MLPQPSLLLNPWVIDTADNISQIAAAGDMPAASPMPEIARESVESEDRVGNAGAANENVAGYEFLSSSALVISNLDIKDGAIEIDGILLEPYSIITVIAADPQQIVQRQVAKELPELKTNDLRLQRSFNNDLHLAQRRQIRMVDKSNPISLSESGIGQMQLYRTVGEILPVLGNLNQDPRFSEFNVLGQWNTLNEDQKKDAYARLACHELHLFLFMKDRAFFETNIKPYLANKKEKQFIDDFLLGNDLSGYVELWKYQQLNAAEKALLAVSMPSKQAAIVRELEEINKINRVSVAAERILVEAAIAGKQFDAKAESVVLNGAMAGRYLGANDNDFANGPAGLGGGGFGAQYDKRVELEQLGEAKDSLAKLERKMSRSENYYFHDNAPLFTR